MSEEVSALGGVAGILILVVISMGILAYALFYTDIFSWENLQKIAPTLVPPILQEGIGDEKTVDLLGSARTSSDFTSVQEVSCDIARSIRDDFVKNGDEKNTRKVTFADAFTDLSKIGSPYFIINSEVLSIPMGSDGNAKGYSLLSAGALEKLSKACDGVNACNGKLDEACVTSFLKNFKVGSLPFCGEFNSDNGKNVKFGNKNCGESDFKKWGDCGAWCGGPDKITKFDQQGVETETYNSINFGESISTESNVGDDKFVPNSASTPVNFYIENNYRYVLYWDKKTKNDYYEIEVLKTPKIKDLGKIDMKELSGALASVFTKDPRSSDAGAKYRDLRQTVKVVFEPSSVVGLKKFLDDFIEAVKSPRMGDEWNYLTEKCSGDKNCLENELQTTKYIQVVSDDGKTVKEDQMTGVNKISLINEPLPCDTVVKSFREVRVRTPLDINNNLSKGEKYMIVLNKWQRTHGRQYQPEGGRYGIFGACIKDHCNIENEYRFKCDTNKFIFHSYQQFDIREIIEWKDFSLIIVPMGGA